MEVKSMKQNAIMKPICLFLSILMLFFSMPLSAKTKKIKAEKKDIFIKKIPNHILKDLKHSFINKNGLFFVMAAAGSLAMIESDPEMQISIGQHRTFNHKFDNIIDHSFSPYVLTGAPLLAYFIARQTDHPKFALAMESAFESVALTMAITLPLKFATDRSRPNGGKRSFPSAHAGASFAMASALSHHYGAKVGIPAFALASLVSWTRVDDDKHHLSDVLFGASLGAFIGWGTAKFHILEDQDLMILPRADNHGVSLTVAKTF